MICAEVDLRKTTVDAVEGSVVGYVRALIGDQQIKAESQTSQTSATNVDIADALRLVRIGALPPKVAICKVASEEVEIQ